MTEDVTSKRTIVPISISFVCTRSQTTESYLLLRSQDKCFCKERLCELEAGNRAESAKILAKASRQRFQIQVYLSRVFYIK